MMDRLAPPAGFRFGRAAGWLAERALPANGWVRGALSG
jgi:hypothetical protein